MKKPKKMKRKPTTMRMDVVSVSVLMEPMASFILQVKSGDVWVNEEGQALMDMPNARIAECVKRGIQPYLAVPQFMLWFEMYFQVVAYCLDKSFLLKAHDQIKQLRLEFVDALKEDRLIEKASIELVEAWIRDMKLVIMSVPKEKVVRVIHEVKSAMKSSNSEEIKTSDVRAWLIEECTLQEKIQISKQVQDLSEVQDAEQRT
jgi:hypothetical protein